jgi:hypothetical protein
MTPRARETTGEKSGDNNRSVVAGTGVGGLPRTVGQSAASPPRRRRFRRTGRAPALVGLRSAAGERAARGAEEESGGGLMKLAAAITCASTQPLLSCAEGRRGPTSQREAAV